jgi:protein-disulfide isomerase
MKAREALASLGACLVLGTVAGTGSLLMTKSFARSSAPVIRPAAIIGNWQQYAYEGQVKGAMEGSVVMIQFVDFQCPACRMFSAVVDSALARYPNDLRVVTRHYPLVRVHPAAEDAAIAAECAAAQDQYAEYSMLLYQRQFELGEGAWTEMARTAGVRDIEGFRECMERQDGAAVVARDMEAGRQLSIRSTPTVIIDGKMYNGGMPLVVLDSLIQAAMIKKGSESTP